MSTVGAHSSGPLIKPNAKSPYFFLTTFKSQEPAEPGDAPRIGFGLGGITILCEVSSQ